MSKKSPAFQFYPNDHIRDLSEHPNEIGGAWTMVFCHLWYSETKGKATKTLDQWSNILREKQSKTFQILVYLQHENIATIEPKQLQNKKDLKITIISRRMVSDEEQREYERTKKQKQRGQGSILPNDVPGMSPDLSPECPVPSSSSSSSSSEKKKKKPKKKVELIAQQQESFNQFWTIWPNKKSKGDAEKAWATIEPDKELLAKILAKIKEGDNSLEWAADDNGKRWIPHPATWLNAKGWDDEYTPVAKKTSPQSGKTSIDGCYSWELHEESEPRPVSPEWKIILDRISPQLDQESFDTWFGPLYPLVIDDKRVEIAVPNKLFASWLTDNYFELIDKALGGRECTLVVVGDINQRGKR